MTTETHLTLEQEREQILAEKQRSGGGRTIDHPRGDYFGSRTWDYTLPDGVSTITHQKLNEGALKEYRNGSQRDVEINRATKNAKIRLAAGDDRALLLEIAVTAWDVHMDGKPLENSPKGKRALLERMDPEVAEGLVKAIHKCNPALAADVTAADIRAEIEQLQETLAEKEKEEEGEASSRS